ncbi:MAG: hypothetical protein AB7P50_03140 [Alphaproteobacteria bacterium]
MKEVAFPASAISAATGCPRAVMRNWLHGGFINIPPAVPSAGSARRYGRANAYEFALLPLVARAAAVSLKLASVMLADRFNWIGNQRAAVLGEPFAGMRSFAGDFEKWGALELIERDINNPTFYVFHDRPDTLPRITGVHASNLAELMKLMDAEVVSVINVTLVLRRVDDRLLRSALPHIEADDREGELIG